MRFYNNRGGQYCKLGKGEAKFKNFTRILYVGGYSASATVPNDGIIFPIIHVHPRSSAQVYIYLNGSILSIYSGLFDDGSPNYYTQICYPVYVKKGDTVSCTRVSGEQYNISTVDLFY